MPRPQKKSAIGHAGNFMLNGIQRKKGGELKKVAKHEVQILSMARIRTLKYAVQHQPPPLPQGQKNPTGEKRKGRSPQQLNVADHKMCPKNYFGNYSSKIRKPRNLWILSRI